jgi:beta-galactosidase
MGEFVWTGFDYLGEPTPYNEEWPSRSSYFGIIDLGGIPKDRFYLYQSQWSDTPVLHLMPHWNWEGCEGQPVDIQCYSNYSSVELFVNGESQGKRWRYAKGRVLASNYRFLWQAVAYQAGEIKVIGYNRDGEIQKETVIRTAGKPAAIEMIADRAVVQADGEDMAFVTLRVLDADGNLCPRADNSISYTVDGPAQIAGLCNGDATSLESFKGTQMKTFNGKCAVYLQSREGETGKVTLTAISDGLVAGEVEIEAI